MSGGGRGDPPCDGLEPRACASRLGVDVKQHVLPGGERLARPAVAHGVEEVQALLVRAEHLRRDLQRLEPRDLVQMPDVRLDRVRAVPGTEVALVHADVAEKGVGRIGEDVEVPGLGHVAVVVQPRLVDDGVVKPQREARVG